MTHPAPDPRSEQASGPSQDPPATGEPEVDRALESLRGLTNAPLADHHHRLARVHEQLHSTLDADRSTRER